jgi:beta-glucosidase
VTPLEGIRRAVSPSTKVWYAQGCKITGERTEGLGRHAILSEALSMAQRADVVVLCLGLNAEIEGEQGDVSNSEGAGDKLHLNLPGLQQRLLEEVVAVGKPTIVVLVSGSALSVTWAEEHADAIVQLFYPGEEGGTALADALFGAYNPGGRLPLTYPRSLEDVPDFADYSMLGRTYRYSDKTPLYPFGYGLSYTRFRYSELRLSSERLGPGDTLEVSVTVTNTGDRAGDEVVELYLKDLEASCRVPKHDLRGFERITLAPGASQRVSFRLGARELSLIDESGARVLEPGRFRVWLGGSQPDARSLELTGNAPLSAELELTGERTPLPY